MVEMGTAMLQRARINIEAALLAIFLACLRAGAAHADAIDGEWCLGTSHFAIQGPCILTPGGNRLQGSSSRRGFVYVVPANERGAGGEINMTLLNEETVQLIRKDSSPEIWRRCKPTS
jgi:hypothetical protein